MKKILSILTFLFIAANFQLQAINNVQSNPFLTEECYSIIQNYLLPDDHPIMPIVDQLFSTRVTYNRSTLENAGFEVLFEQPRSRITVAKHAALPGYLFKLYYDTELATKMNVPGWMWFARRCEGAELIRNVINQYNMTKFVVPHKYIYLLPPSTAPQKTARVDPKLAILIVDDMHLVSEKANLKAWRKMDKQALNELYIIMSLANGSSYRADNIAYTKFGNFAFIDTEYPFRKPNYNNTRPYFSSKMRKYWDLLVKQRGPK